MIAAHTMILHLRAGTVYLCLCKGVTEAEVRRLAREGVLTAPDLIKRLGLAEKRLCGRCIREIAEFVELATIEDLTSAVESRKTNPETAGT
jgi:bacterioferritin-associated ferredoxin